MIKFIQIEISRFFLILPDNTEDKINTVVDDAIRFVSKSKDKAKTNSDSSEAKEHGYDENPSLSEEEEPEEQAVKITATTSNQVF